MHINQAGVDLIKKWEGRSLKAYRDSVGVLTIGFGHTSMAGLPVVKDGMRITEDEAEDILRNDLVKYENGVKGSLTHEPTDNQFAAMVSLCYNIGQGAFRRSSVAKRFNIRDYIGSANAFLMWNKAGGKTLRGLVNRRKDERQLFLS